MADHRGSSRSGSFSFHCTICYEELNLTSHPPVVLPCGHTYLCAVCAKRLTRCMECRLPLTRPPMSPSTRKSPSSPSSPSHFRVSAVDSPRAAPRSPRSKVPPQDNIESLPTPRNLVLMSLIESAQLTSIHRSDSGESRESLDEDSFVESEIPLLYNGCGTYVVRDPSGLLLLEKSPLSEPKKDNESANDWGGNSPESLNHPRTDDADTKQPSGQQYDPEVDTNSQPDCVPAKEEEPVPEKPKQRLLFGQTVQVVAFEESVAILARGQGYVVVKDPSQLVRVGDALDDACKFEGMRRTISSQIQDMERRHEQRLESMRAVETRLSSMLDEALHTEVNCDTYPILSGIQRGEELLSLEESKSESPSLPPPIPLTNSLLSSVAPERPEAQKPDGLWPNDGFDAAACLKGTLSDVGLHVDERDDYSPYVSMCTRILPALACTDFLPSFLKDRGDNLTSPAPLLTSSALQETIEELPKRFVGVDFRTGLSGHRALTSASSHAQKSRDGHAFRRSRMMSQHNGISANRRIRRQVSIPSPKARSPGSFGLMDKSW